MVIARAGQTQIETLNSFQQKWEFLGPDGLDYLSVRHYVYQITIVWSLTLAQFALDSPYRFQGGI